VLLALLFCCLAICSLFWSTFCALSLKSRLHKAKPTTITEATAAAATAFNCAKDQRERKGTAICLCSSRQYLIYLIAQNLPFSLAVY